MDVVVQMDRPQDLDNLRGEIVVIPDAHVPTSSWIARLRKCPRVIRRCPERIGDRVVGVVAYKVENLLRDLVRVVETGQGLRLPTGRRDGDRSLDADGPVVQESLQVADGLRDLVKIAVEADNDSDVAQIGEDELDHIQGEDEIDTLLLRTLPGSHGHGLGRESRAGWRQGLLVSPRPVVAKRSCHHGDSDVPHRVQPAIEVPRLRRLAGDIRIRATRIEPTGNTLLRSRAREMFREEMWVAEGVAEQLVAALVEVLAVDEHHDPGGGVGGQRGDGGIRHRA